jgi:hypothetical protein
MPGQILERLAIRTRESLHQFYPVRKAGLVLRRSPSRTNNHGSTTRSVIRLSTQSSTSRNLQAGPST